MAKAKAIQPDYLGQMLALIDEEVQKDLDGNGHYVAVVVAERLVRRLDTGTKAEQDLLDGYLGDRAVKTLRIEIVDRGTQFRKREIAKSIFAEAAERYKKTRDRKKLEPFVDIFKEDFAVNEDDERRLLGDMTIEDHEFVAKAHHERSKTDAFEAAWHTAVAKHMAKIGAETTREAYSEQQYYEMRKAFSV